MQTKYRTVLESSGRASVLRRALPAVVMIGLAGLAFGQTAATFEVSHAGRLQASGRSHGNSAWVSRTPQRFAFQSALMGDLVAFAYGFPPDRVERKPQWMYDDLYDVAVTTAAPASLPEQRVLLQKLLEARFGLVVHRASYGSTVYYLVSGPKVNLTPAQEPDASEEQWQAAYPGGSGFQGITFYPFERGRVASHVSMSDVAAWLYTQVQLPVVDKTGITGFFDIDTPSKGVPGLLTLPVLTIGGAHPISPDEVTIQAVQRDLGLGLEVHPGTAESLIIDRAERPQEN